jgi:carbon monoxide dehydrogenase subunit G
MQLDLTERSAAETELQVSSDVSFLGKLGELGQPIIRRKADSVIKEFASNLSREAESL